MVLLVCKRKSERERGRERERLGESVRGDGDHSLMVEEGHEGGARHISGTINPLVTLLDNATHNSTNTVWR